MKKKSTEPRYVAYVRKSDPRKERQVLSHTTQTRRIKEQFPDLNIIKWLPAESESAFKPGRPIFNQALQMIKNGEADGIVCYTTNRLSRNEIDAAEVTYLLRQNVLKGLKFCNYSFENTPEGIMILQMLLSQSQYESSKQGKFVRDGMEQKAITGERPGSVALGYKKVPKLDEHGEPIIRPKDQKVITYTDKDPERYDLVNKMWTMLLSGKYSVAQIRKIANDEWHFTTREYKGRVRKGGNGPISQSGMYRIFTNVYYAGWIVHNGELHKGNHPAMISAEDFDYIQKMLGGHGKPRSGVREYAYTSIMRCGVCGCSIAGKLRRKWIKSEERYKTYVYYYCIRKSDNRPCNQKIYTTLEELEAQIDLELKKYTILPEFRDLAIEILHKNHLIEVKERNQVAKTQTHKKEEVQKQIDELVAMRTRQLLDDEEYIDQKNKLKLEMARVIDSISNTDKRADEWLELTEEAFNFAKHARTRFAHSNDLTVKRDILLTLGQNLLLKDRKLILQTSSWLIPLGEKYPELERAYLREVRTVQNTNRKVLLESLTPIIESWRAQWDSNPRHPA
jgi:site-specific DNA recombinase